MLTQEERFDIRDRLVRVVSPAPSPRQVLAASLDVELQVRLGEGLPVTLVEQALQLVAEDAYRRDPPAMIRFLTMLLPGDPAAERIIGRLRTPPPSLADPFDAVILVSKLPFLDRHSTRRALRRFLEPPQPGLPVVAIVNGRTGKTYTGELVEHVLHTQAAVRSCRIELDERQGASVGIAELARDIVTGMGGDPSSQPAHNTNLDRAAQEFANWIISVGNASPYRWWIVLDGFNPDELRQDAQLLVTKLAASLTTGVARERHRLILTDFDRSVLSLRPGSLVLEETSPIPHASVAAAIAQVIGFPAQSAEVAAVAEKVLAELDDPVTDLPELNRRLCDLIASAEHVAELRSVTL
jgi:hypothetical protein